MAETHVTPFRNLSSDALDLAKIESNVSKGSTKIVNNQRLRIPVLDTPINNSNIVIFPFYKSSGLNLQSSYLPSSSSLQAIIIMLKGSIYIKRDIIMFLTFKGEIWNYSIINYSSEFLTFTDIQSLGFLLYLAFPFITILLGIILWCVLVGILRISSSQ